MSKKEEMKKAEIQNPEQSKKLNEIMDAVEHGADPLIFIYDINETLADLNSQINLYSKVDDIERVKEAYVYKSLVQDCQAMLLKKLLDREKLKYEACRKLYLKSLINSEFKNENRQQG